MSLIVRRADRVDRAFAMLRAARELQWSRRMYEFTPLGQAYQDFLRHVGRDNAVCRAMDRALPILDDLYGGDDKLLQPGAVYEIANSAQRRLASDAYKHVLACLVRVRAPRQHRVATRLLETLMPFVRRNEWMALEYRYA